MNLCETCKEKEPVLSCELGCGIKVCQTCTSNSFSIFCLTPEDKMEEVAETKGVDCWGPPICDSCINKY